MKNQTKANFIHLAALALLAGCAVGPGYEIVPTDGPTTLGPTPGDRDDVPRALDVALSDAEAAMLSGAWEGDTYTARLLVIENREGVATASRVGDGLYTLTAFVEPDGDQVAQQRLLDTWARRLRQLHGVEWAPR